MTQRIDFEQREFKGQLVWMVNTAPELRGVDFTRKQIHEDIFKDHELEELLIAAKAQNEPTELIDHIEQILGRHFTFRWTEDGKLEVNTALGKFFDAPFEVVTAENRTLGQLDTLREAADRQGEPDFNRILDYLRTEYEKRSNR